MKNAGHVQKALNARNMGFKRKKLLVMISKIEILYNYIYFKIVF